MGNTSPEDPPRAAPKILVIHADRGVRALLVRRLASLGYAPAPVGSGEEAIDLAGSERIPLALLDLELPGLSGLETLQALRAMAPPPEVVVTMGRHAPDAVAEATRHGAFEFIRQPIDFEQLREILQAAHAQARRQPQRGARPARAPLPEVVGTSAGIKQVQMLVRRAARSHFPVLIQGESGTGKELVARMIHALGPRVRLPLVIVDCGALQDTLLESELFGHERGAFTGAHALKHGLFETADHGTAFLDEIGEMSPVMQVKVLRALQSGEFRRVGSNNVIRADIRVIAATNRDLPEEVSRGRFREDLYYRIAVIDIRVPPLRERREDIPLLVAHFLREGGSGGRRPLEITAEAMERLTVYPWPGNIRELRNCIERLSVLADDVVTVESLPPSILARSRLPGGARDAAGDLPLEEVERLHILRTLERHQGNKTRAAAILGIDTKTLYNKLRRYGVPLSGGEAGRT